MATTQNLISGCVMEVDLCERNGEYTQLSVLIASGSSVLLQDYFDECLIPRFQPSLLEIY